MGEIEGPFREQPIVPDYTKAWKGYRWLEALSRVDAMALFFMIGIGSVLQLVRFPQLYYLC